MQMEEDGMEDKKEYIVDGFLFESPKQAQIARKELQGILFLQKNNNMKDPKVLLQVYNKVLEQRLFSTVVGLNSLKKIQSELQAKGVAEELLPIPVVNVGAKKDNPIRERKTMMELNDVGDVYKKKFRFSLLIIAILSACLIFMVVVASTTNSPHILNYEEKIITKYEKWEQELEQREQALDEKKGE